MKEEFLSYVWQYQLFNQNNLKTDDGKNISIIENGQINTNAGPDFFNAKLKINDTVWAGNVEIHTKASHWKQHQHQTDTAYDNVILHVVYENDDKIVRTDGTPISTLSLQNKINATVALQWNQLQSNKGWIPCEKSINTIDDFTWLQWKDRLVVDRLQSKAKQINELLEFTNNDWNTCFYIYLARSFGMKINQLPFEQLAKVLPLNIVQKHSNNPLQVEALFFGQAGFLEKDFKETYPNELKKEYLFLQKKYSLTSLKQSIWKFSKLRPANFPTLRIAQLAALINNQTDLLSTILAQDNIKDIVKLFQIKVNNYWTEHYNFNKKSSKKMKHFGKNTIDSILINSVIPFIFIYEKSTGQASKLKNVLALLEQIPAEKNNIIKRWTALDVKTQHAYDTQALLQLKNEYCRTKRCLQCAIGNKVLKQ